MLRHLPIFKKTRLYDIRVDLGSERRLLQLSENNDNALTQSDLSKVSKTDVEVSLSYPLTTKLINLTKCRSNIFDKKNDFSSQINEIMTLEKDKRIIKDENILNRSKLKRRSKIKIPKYLYDFTETAILEPNPIYGDTKEWFCSGGRLDVIESETDKWLVTCFDDILYFLPLTQRKFNQMLPLDIDKVFSLNTQSINDNSYISLRSKYNGRIIKLNTDQVEESEMIFSYDSEDVPIIDIKLNPLNVEESVILDLNRNTKIFNIVSNKMNKFEFNINENCIYDDFLQCQYTSVNDLVIMDRKNITLLDTRSKQTLQTASYKPSFFKCDELCGVEVNKCGNNYIYFASVHNILKFDKRMLNIIKIWPHYLSQPPLYFKTYNDLKHGAEAIVVASQNQNGKVFITDRPGENMVCKQVPDNLETLKLLGLKSEKYLDEDILKRLSLHTTGVAISSHNLEVHLYSYNSLGDVFVNTIGESNYSLEPVVKLSSWIDTLFQKAKEPLQITDLLDMSEAAFIFSHNRKTQNFNNFTKEGKAKELIASWKDDMNDMAAVWDAHPQNNFSYEDSTGAFTLTSKKKVTEWLNL